jgi:hypothetical protein
MHDSDIRQILLKSLSQRYSKSKNTMLVEELGLFQGDARIDIAVINGSLHGYEIKSDRDNFSRVSSQLQAYSKIFDYLTFVVGATHMSKAQKILPSWCGLSVVEKVAGELKIKKIRKPKKNDLIDANSLVQLIWKDEALNVLRELGSHKGLSKAIRTTIWSRLVEQVSLPKLKKIIRHTLLSRQYWRDPKHTHKLLILG